jgi:hypothetical protein
MPTISFELSNDHTARLTAALCGLHNYDQVSQETEETEAQFSRRILRVWLKSQVRRWEQLESQRIAADSLTEIEVE